MANRTSDAAVKQHWPPSSAGRLSLSHDGPADRDRKSHCRLPDRAQSTQQQSAVRTHPTDPHGSIRQQLPAIDNGAPPPRCPSALWMRT